MLNQNTFKSSHPKVYLVGTPIGNLGDLSFRAVEILKTVDLIFCEDTRTSRVLLEKYGVKNKLSSLHKFNETEKFPHLAKALFASDSIAIISDAGVPLIADPGLKIVHLIRQEFGNTVDVSAVNVGPAYLHALLVSGFLNPSHYFYGFLKNRTSSAKTTEIKQLIHHSWPATSLVFYESVHRIKKTILSLSEVLPPTTKILLARELTKINEQILLGTIEEIQAFVESSAFVEKGEFVVVLDKPKAVFSVLSEPEIIKLMGEEIKKGVKVKTAAQQISQNSALKANEIYQIYVKRKKNF